jgi:anti-anti-sigma factor
MPPTAPVLRVDLTRGGGFTVARVAGCGSLTEENAPALDRELEALPGPWDGQRLLLDLGGIRSLGGAACGTLLRLNQAVRAGRGRLTLIGVRRGPYRVLTASGLDRILDIRPVGRRAGSGVGPTHRRRYPKAGGKPAGDPVGSARQTTPDGVGPALRTDDAHGRSSTPIEAIAGGEEADRDSFPAHPPGAARPGPRPALTGPADRE